MNKIDEINTKLKPLLKELVQELTKGKIPCQTMLPGKGYEVIIKKQGFKILAFDPPKCIECDYQMTYEDWDEEDWAYFCPECGQVFENIR